MVQMIKKNLKKYLVDHNAKTIDSLRRINKLGGRSLIVTSDKKILKGILSIEKRPLVSSDFLNNPNSVIIDTLSTMVVNKKLLKVFGWYDNEYAYALRMIDILKLISKKI